MSEPTNDFIGPCAHGRDPYERCDDCGELEPWQAEIVALKAQLAKALRAWDLIAWMADSYAEAGGSGGPERRAYMEALEDIARIRAAHPESPEAPKEGE